MNSPNLLLSFVNCLSPSNTCTVTAGWLSEYVLNVCDFFVGIVLLRSIIFVITPPLVSTPSESGQTSRRSKSSILLSFTPERSAAWTAAPYATASSGLIDLLRSLPLKKSLNCFWIFGIRVDPPTKITSWICDLLKPLSLITCSTGSKVFLKRSPHNSSKRARVIVEAKSIPSNKLSTSNVACVEADNVFFKFSHVVLKRRIARLFSLKSFLCLRLNSCIKWWTRRVSKSSPPK